MDTGLLLSEGLAVCASGFRRILLVGTHQDPLQGAVIRIFAMVCALLNGAFDALIGMAAHIRILLF
jgi:hypothetical protein